MSNMGPPNVLLIMTDQQRCDSLGCYGSKAARTPHLDALAAGGLRFEKCYVANPICMPNRTSLFTGRYPRSHGTWTNGLLPEHVPYTIAQHFALAGYETAAFGKLHFTPYDGDAGNCESLAYWQRRASLATGGSPQLEPFRNYWGFERVEFTIGHTAPVAHYGSWFRAHGGTDAMLTPDRRTGTRPIPVELHDSTFVAERTAAFLRKERDQKRPFFAVASFPDPHHPFNPPDTVASSYSPDEMPKPIGSPSDLDTRPEHYRQHLARRWHRSGLLAKSSSVSREMQQRRVLNTYAMVDLIDRSIGTILAALDETGLRANTIIVFTSDHGELLGDHGLWYKGPFFFEGLVRVPLLVAGPGVARGTVSQSLISTVDLAPTLADLAGIDPLPFAEGVSQRRTCADPSVQARDRCLIEYRNGYGEADVASATLVTPTTKYTRYETGEEELTDLANDPEERRNVAADAAYQDEVLKQRELLLDTLLATQARGPIQVGHA